MRPIIYKNIRMCTLKNLLHLESVKKFQNNIFLNQPLFHIIISHVHCIYICEWNMVITYLLFPIFIHVNDMIILVVYVTLRFIKEEESSTFTNSYMNVLYLNIFHHLISYIQQFFGEQTIPWHPFDQSTRFYIDIILSNNQVHTSFTKRMCRWNGYKPHYYTSF